MSKSELSSFISALLALQKPLISTTFSSNISCSSFSSNLKASSADIAGNILSNKSRITTLKEAFEAKLGKENVVYAKGSEILEEKEINSILQADGGKITQVENEKEKLKQYRKEAIEGDTGRK